MTLLIILGVILIAVGVGIGINNDIIAKSNRVNQSWSDVITQERARGKIIEAVEKLVNEYTEFEQSLLTATTKLREAITEAKGAEAGDVDKIHNIEIASKELNSGLKITVEAYPDLKASNLYSQLATEISEQEDNVAAAIRIFNSNVAEFNTSIETFPANLINNKFTKKKQVNSYENDDIDVGFTPNLNKN
ncbi:LemA family protein [Vibrio fluvialis]|nr:LemA family protein [Vibrio fluvialis]MBY7902314.1 LemA family protein [Vibrio fluvialis]